MTTAAARQRLKYACVSCQEPTDAFVGTARAEVGTCRACYGKGVDRRPRELNELSGKEWAHSSRSEQEYPDTRSEKQRVHGAAFPMSLAKQQISVYTRESQVVLDPFAGVGTTLDACSDLGRRGIGVELNPQYAALAQADVAADPKQRVIIGDSLHLTDYVKPESVDFLLTSPPYGSLLKNVKGAFAYKWQEHSTIAPIRNAPVYSDDPQDFGNMEYPAFLDAIERVMESTFVVLKDDAYAAWVVKDFRALKEKIPYVAFHMHLVQRAEAAGFTLWDLQIYDQTKFRPLVCLGYPSKNFYLNIGHSYIVILRKRR
jgi:DNA modification methylase